MKKILLGAGCAICALMSFPARAQVRVTVDAAQEHQTMVGFGATNLSLSFAEGTDADQRARAVQACYGDVGINTGNVNVRPQETPGTFEQQKNDDGDPRTFNWSGFSTWQSAAMKEKVIDVANSYSLVLILGPLGLGVARRRKLRAART